MCTNQIKQTEMIMNRVKRQEHRYATEMWFLSETEQMSSKSHNTATVTLVSVYNPTESSVTESSNPQCVVQLQSLVLIYCPALKHKTVTRHLCFVFAFQRKTGGTAEGKKLSNLTSSVS